MHRLLLSSLLALGCVQGRDPEAWEDWYGAVGPLDEDVEEPILFTEEPYDWADFSGGIATLTPLMENFTRKFAPSEVFPPGCDGWEHDTRLPREFWAMVTLHPRLYYKGVGCTPNPQPRNPITGQRLDSEEKYYGNFFLEDDSGGIFVLNDSKVAHFRMGDRLRIRVNGVGERFGLQSIVSHEILEVDRGPYPISWTPAGSTTCTTFSGAACADVQLDDPESIANFIERDCSCTYDDPSLVGRVLRAEGVVFTETDTFGTFFIETDSGDEIQVSLDSELNRRKHRFAIGERVRVTGPVLNAFGNPIVILKVGQTERLD